MFEFLKRIAGTRRANLPRFQPADPNGDIVMWVDMPRIAEPAIKPAKVMQRLATTDASSSTHCADVAAARKASSRSNRRRKGRPQSDRRRLGSHRERLLAMKLEHLKLFPLRRTEQLAAIGVHTAGDLVFGEVKEIAATFDHSPRAERALRRYRAAIRMALAVDSMMPRDALLLVAIHRRSVASLSRESAAQLHRDLERFSLSTRGSKLVGRRGVPSLRRVKTWVATCRELAERSSSTNVVPAIG